MVRKEKGPLLMNFATGFIFEYDDERKEGSGIGFKEDDKPNFVGAFCSKSKARVKKLSNLCIYSNLGIFGGV